MRSYYRNIGAFGLRDVLELTASRLDENRLTESVQKQVSMNFEKDLLPVGVINNAPCNFA